MSARMTSRQKRSRSRSFCKGGRQRARHAGGSAGGAPRRSLRRRVSGRRAARGGGAGRTEGLLDLLADGDEAEVDEGGDADAGDGVPLEEVDELEGQREEVEPDGADSAIVRIRG